jgi:hypothetical protein
VLAPIHCHPTSGYQPRPVAAVSVPAKCSRAARNITAGAVTQPHRLI